MNYKYVNNHEVYAWIGNALRVCTIEKQIIDGEEPALFVRCDFKKDELIEISWRMVFKSIEDYEANKPADLYGLSECQMKMENHKGIFKYAYIEGGRVIEADFDKTVEAVWDEECERWRFSSSDLPAEYYPNKDIAFGMIQYEAIDKEGNSTIRKGALRKIMLTDEQKKLVSDFKKAWDKAKKAGVQFFYDRDYDKLYAVNAKDVEVESDCYSDAGDDMDVALVNGYGIEDNFNVHMDFGFMNEEYQIFVKK